MLLDLLEFPIKPATAVAASAVRLYSAPSPQGEDQLVYEVLVPGSKKSDIKLLKTSKGIDVKVSYPTYPQRTYKFPVLDNKPKTYSLSTFVGLYEYSSSSLEDGILSVTLVKKEGASTEISW